MKVLTSLFFVSLLALAGCEEGPAEDMGEEIDDAVSESQDAIEDATN